jgi:hypothetical protein
MKHLAALAGLLFALALGGCGGGNALDGAAPHLLTCMGADALPRIAHAQFKMAVEANEVANARAALEAYRTSIAEQKAKLAALPPHPWQSTKDCVAAVERLLQTEETVVASEMAKIIDAMNEGAPSEAQRRQIAASFARIDAIVEEKARDSSAAWNRLRLELAAEAQSAKDE